MQTKISRSEFALRSKRTDYQLRELGLLARLRRELSGDCYVSFSAGKDSVVVAHACHAIRPGIPILMCDPGVPVHWLANEREQWLDYAKRNAWNLRLFPWEKFSNSAAIEKYNAHPTSVHNSMFRDIAAYAQKQGLKRRVMGLRRDESHARAFVRAATKNTLCPIASWTVNDVWCYIIRHDLPWLSIYDHLGPNARNGIIGRNGREHGRIEYLRKFFPEAYRHARELGITE